MTAEIYIGVMSGTSLDAIDAAMVEFNDDPKLRLIATHSLAIPAELRSEILQLCQPGSDHVHRLGKTDTELGLLFAECCLQLLEKSKMSAKQVLAIGNHGQTIRHVPHAEIPFTLQIGDPNIISTLTNITTVADFRRRDLALGGQAAPLAPAFHQYLFQERGHPRFIVNIGGMANLTYLPGDLAQPVIGFDTGPGNTLIDQWMQQHCQQPYDRDGAWAAGGQVNAALLNNLLQDPYFSAPAPKSTGREYFNLNWLATYCATETHSLSAQDIQATLTALTAQTIADAIQHTDAQANEVFLCGGGAYNQYLVQCLQSCLPTHRIASTMQIGLDPKWVEAATFAWLAKQTMHRLPGNLPSVTGARRASILGAIYPTIH